MSAVAELQDAVAEIVRRVGPAVVGLGGRRGLGSGVMVAEGAVLTNAHNLRSEEVTVTFADGRTETGRVRGVDLDGDIAVIAVDTDEAAPLEYAPDPSAAGIGTAVFALANPGGRGLRATLGLVSFNGRSFRGPRGRRIPGGIEHTAPLVRGSSGGPLVDGSGRLLGLNSVRLEGGLILALPADAGLRKRAAALAEGRPPGRRRLGVSVAPARVARRLRRAVGLPEREGVLVRAVEEGSPAERAGLEPGDLIAEAGTRPVQGVDDLYRVLDSLDEGAGLALTLVRGIEERRVEVTFDDGRRGS